MDNESHKNTWNNFTKFALGFGSCGCSSCFDGNFSVVE